MLEIRLLGMFELRQEGNVVLLPSRPAQSLLAYLVLSAGTAHRREKLAGLLWPDSDDDNSRSNLRHALWRIRKAIERDDGVAPYLLTDELAVSFNAGADYWVDAALLARDGESLTDQFGALALYQGELLPGFYDDWVTLERERLDALFQHRMQRLVERLVDERRWSDVLEWGERWVARGHAPEPGYRALMLAYAELGDRSRAAVVYQRCREALFNELGVEPSTATRRLHERLRSDEPEVAPVLAPAVTGSMVDDEQPAPGESPFPGLRYFDEGDANRFFGREALTAQLLGRLDAERFLAVLGASGSGKSSVVRAGLVPALRRSKGTGTVDVRVLTPTAHPLDALAESLDPNGVRETLLDELGRDPSGLARHLAKNGRNRVLLVVDQFEELFTLCHDRFEREAFAENLLAAAQPNGLASVVIALRADFYAHCAEHPPLREAVAHHQEYVGSLSPLELRRAIEGPAAQGSWELEPGLVDLLLRDVGDEPGALPLLSHALLETWQRRRGRRLTLAAYTAAGGIHGGIAQTAEAVFSQRLTRGQQSIARRVFLQLTELGDGTQDTRRRTTISELVGRPDGEADVRAVLQTLSDARLITLDQNSVEVAHEALIREWPRLREWLTQDRENLRLQRQLTRTAEEWDRLGRDAGGLYRSARLAQALDWSVDHPNELGVLETAFLLASREAAELELAEREAQHQRELEAARQLADAEQRRADSEHQRADDQRQAASQLRRRAVLLGFAFAVALVMAAAAAFFGDTAFQQAARAQADARAAVSRELAAASLTNLTVDPERAALLALQAVDVTHGVDGSWTAEAEDALHRVLPLLRAQLTLAGHTGKLLSVAFSSDGRRLITAGDDGTARVWDTMTGQEQLNLRGHTGAVNAAAFSPDGHLIATASDDRTAKVWDAENGQARATLVGHAREVERLAFSPDGTRLATSSLDGTVALWDAVSGTNLASIRPNRAGDLSVPLDVAFSPDSKRMATVIPDGEIAEWDLSAEQPRLERSWVVPENRTLARSVAFSPDGIWLASTTDTGVRVWWAESGEASLNIVGHAVQTLDTVYSPDGARIATASADRTAKIWDARTGRELLTLAGHTAPVDRVAFSTDGQRLATASWDGTAKIWDLSLAHEVLTISTSGPGFAASLVELRPAIAAGSVGGSLDPSQVVDRPLLGQIAVSPDGHSLLAGVWDGASTWNTLSGQETLDMRGTSFQVWGAAMSPDGSRFATGSADHSVRMWDPATHAMLWSDSGHTDRVNAVAFSSDASRLASAGADGLARILEVASGKELMTLRLAAPVTSVAFSPDGSRLATAGDGREGPVGLWDVGSGRLELNLDGHHDAVWSVNFSPDGKRLATAGRDGTARIWDTTNGQELLTLTGDGGTLVSAIFSPDGQQLATGSRNGSVQVWDVVSGRLLQELALGQAGVAEGVDSLAFSPDGRQLIARGDLAIQIFALPIEDVTGLVRSRLTRTWSVDECRRYLHTEQCPQTAAPTVRTSVQQQSSLASSVSIVQPGASAALTGSIKIVSSLPRGAGQKAHTDGLVNAFKMALDEHNNRVGNAAVIYEDLDDSNPVTGNWDGNIEIANANKAANDPSVMVYLGTWNSAAARVAIPILCRASLAMVSPANTYPGLTKRTPYNTPNEPDVYYPGCPRNYARVLPTDDQQGVVGAAFAQHLGASRVYVLRDPSSAPYAAMTSDAFATTATSLGLQLVGGPEDTDPSASSYRDLAQRILRARPDLVYFSSYNIELAARLWQDLRATLGGDVKLMAADGIASDAFLQAAGSVAEGTYATSTGISGPSGTARGADWYRRYTQQFQTEPFAFSPFAYEAMNVALAGIERAGAKDRAAVRDAILATRNYRGVLGDWSFTETGDTTLNTMTILEVRGGRWDVDSIQSIASPH